MKGVNQFINGVQAVFFREIGQMSITCGCRGAGVPEDHLNMTKGVDMDFFLMPHWFTTAFMAA